MLTIRVRLRPERFQIKGERVSFKKSDISPALGEIGYILLQKVRKHIISDLDTLEKYGRKRTNKLLNAFYVRLLRSGKYRAIVAISAEPDVPYVYIHEYGGEVHPTGNRRMPIPIYSTMQKYGWETIQEYAKRFRSFVKHDIFFIKDGKTIIPAFKLQWSAFIPSRNYITNAIIDFLNDPNVNATLEQIGAKMALDIVEYKR